MKLKLRTEIQTPRRPGLLSHSRPVILLGSCFSDNIGRRLAERGFSVAANPLGPVYNPLSMAAQAELIASGREIVTSELFEYQGLWRHFMAHTLLARPSAVDAADAMNRSLDEVRRQLSHEALLCLTLGTAWVYELASDFAGLPASTVVANCHKLPASRFDRRMADVAEAYEAVASAIKYLTVGDTVITVSPIRHLADGLEGNSLSKSTLRLAADRAAADGAVYFPAFEAVIDDLRDYRFYTPDMTHPTEQAADYVYGLFEETFADSGTVAKSAEYLKASRHAAHRPLFGSDGA